MKSAPERKWAMVRIGAGDYLLPSNDGATLWRIYRYEDADNAGPLRMFWAAARYDGTMAEAERLMNWDPHEFLSWIRWSSWHTLLATRKEAIAAAVRTGSI